MKILKKLRLYFNYRKWLRLRNSTKDEYGEKLCYCGHTHMCTCADPDIKTFELSVENKTIILNDKNNGWETIED